MRQNAGAIATVDEIRHALAPALKKGGAKKAIVFGSYARGDADRYSGLDLIIVAETAASFFSRHEAFSGIYDVWRRGLDLLIYTHREVEKMLSERRAYIEVALKEDVVIYEE